MRYLILSMMNKPKLIFLDNDEMCVAGMLNVDLK